jgi:hypothetical protein
VLTHAHRGWRFASSWSHFRRGLKPDLGPGDFGDGREARRCDWDETSKMGARGPRRWGFRPRRIGAQGGPARFAECIATPRWTACSRSRWTDAVTAPFYRERLVAAVPCGYPISEHVAVDWERLRSETFLVQGQDNSHSAREFYASLMGYGPRFESHAGSKQCVFALVAAGFGITLATTSQAEVVFPGVVYRAICEENAWVQVELAWCPDAEDPAVGRFVASMRDEARSRRLF